MTKTIAIVGAGSAGSLLANRLSENANQRVVLLEAGPDYFGKEIPKDLTDGRRNSLLKHDWGFWHKPNPNQIPLRFPRGKVVGGSSAVNTCIALRGDREDYEEWDLPLWDWATCLSAFCDIENDLDFGDKPYHGSSGELPIKRATNEEWVVWQREFVNACESIGYPRCSDLNAPGSVGVGSHAMNRIDGVRVSAADVFLSSTVRDRENLELKSGVLVERVKFTGRRATGVSYLKNGERNELDADEVLLAAGAIHTPHLLLRSGVGPQSVTQSWGIDHVVENPRIGAELLDHPGLAMFFRPKRGTGTSTKDPLIQTLCRTSSGVADLENDLVLQPGSVAPFSRGALPWVSIMTMIGKPRGVGSLSWKSADPRARPKIDSNLLTHPDDIRMAVVAFEKIREIAAQQSLVSHIYPRKKTAYGDLSQIVHKFCDSGYHPCGTAPMGTSIETGACDEDGRVFGCENLRVVDASLIPTIPYANIHLTVLMIAQVISQRFAL